MMIMISASGQQSTNSIAHNRIANIAFINLCLMGSQQFYVHNYKWSIETNFSGYAKIFNRNRTQHWSIVYTDILKYILPN